MNTNPYITTDYEIKSNWTFGENKPNQSQFQTQGFLAKTMRFATLERQLCNGAPGSPLANQTESVV